MDDDPRKQGMRVAGYKVLGTTDELARVLDAVKPDEVLIAIPSAPGTRQSITATSYSYHLSWSIASSPRSTASTW